MDLRAILVPYDGSDFSENALDYAAYLAKTVFVGNLKRQSIKIVILHIVPEICITKSILDRITKSSDNEGQSFRNHINKIYQQLKNAMEKELEQKKDMYERLEGIKIEPVILYGNPSNKIIEYVHNNMIDLVVIASNGLQGLSKVKALGSVSRKVSEQSNCPVLIMH
jgi:nucleotide-binding universal stress UspA family protein